MARARDNLHNLRTTPGSELTPLEGLEMRAEDLINGSEHVSQQEDMIVRSFDVGDWGSFVIALRQAKQARGEEAR